MKDVVSHTISRSRPDRETNYVDEGERGPVMDAWHRPGIQSERLVANCNSISTVLRAFSVELKWAKDDTDGALRWASSPLQLAASGPSI